MKCRHEVDALNCMRCAPDSADVYRMDDGGVSVQVECADTGREMTLVVTGDSQRVYFVARGDGNREAGIVTNAEGVGKLMHWLSGAAFDAAGLVVGKVPR